MSPIVLLFGLLISLAVAIVPAVLWSLVVWSFDRYEREPIPLVAGTFLWGALPAALLALLVEAAVSGLFRPAPPSLAGEVLSSSGTTPIIEELAKAGALFLLLLLWPDEIDDTLDGIVYGALIGFGFAMTENVLYFVATLLQGDWVKWGGLLFLRSVVFGLNHAFFTAFIGAAIGYGRVIASRRGRLGLLFLGLGAAILAHALHNLGATLTDVSPLGLLMSLGSDSGGVILVGVMLWLALRQERDWLRSELQGEVGVTLTTADYTSLLTLRGRWAMLGVARRAGGMKAARLAGQFQQQATELAFYKHRVRVRGGDERAVTRIAELTRRLADLRVRLVQATVA
jgi:protease PrsW